jgi:hypothetical protein
MRTFGSLCLTVLLSSANAAEAEQFADVAVKAIPVCGNTFFGGNVHACLANVTQVLEMIPADTRIVPGHEPLASKCGSGSGNQQQPKQLACMIR